jgi:hypothetical protein
MSEDSNSFIIPVGLNITKLDAQPGDTLLVEVDVGNLPPIRAKQYLDEVRGGLKKLLPSVTLILAAKDRISVTKCGDCDCSNC